MTKDLTELQGIEYFKKNYIEYTDSGVIVNFVGKDGVDIDDYVASILTPKQSDSQPRNEVIDEIVVLIANNYLKGIEEIKALKTKEVK